jgi:hypothetical protein
LESFSAYCQERPEQRFWQALRNWSGVAFLRATTASGKTYDTFYTERGVLEESFDEDDPPS